MHQPGRGALHGKVQPLEQMPPRPGVIAHGKFLLNYLGDQGEVHTPVFNP